MYRTFLKIHFYFQKNKNAGFLLLLVFVAATAFFASKITLEEDVSRLIPSGQRQDILKKVLDETSFSDKIIVTISAESDEINPNELTRYAQQLTDSLESDFEPYIENIQGKIPEENVLDIYDFVYNNLPLFLNSTDYERIEARITPDSIKTRVKSSYKNLISPTGLVTKEFIFKDPLSITTIGLEKLRELQVGDNFTLHNDFVLTKDKKHVLLFITPVNPVSETSENAIFVEKLQNLQSNLNAEFPGIKGEFFGGILYSLANANQIKKDIQLTVGIAVVILLVLLIFFYRRFLVPLILFIPSILGGLVGITALYFFRENVSAISLGIGAVLLGISLDYALHILTHFRNNNDIKELYRDVTRPILMSSLTTGVAFLCLLFIKSEALKDLGIFAAVSVISASLFALVVIPLMYKAPENLKQQHTFLDKLAAIKFYRSKPLVIFFLVLLVSSVFFFNKVKFNEDISKLNYEPTEVKTAEEKVMQIAGRASKSLYLVSYGNTIDQALLVNNRIYNKLKELEQNNGIENFSSIGGVVLSTETQTRKIEDWEEFWDSSKKENLKEELIAESGNYGFKAESFQYFYAQLNRNFKEIFLDDYHNTSGMYLEDFISESDDFATVTSTINLEESKLDDFKTAFSEEENVVIIDRKQINESFLGNLKENFNRLIAFSLVAVFLILLLFYRNFEISLLTLLPIGATWVITLAILAVFGIEFNVLNIIISTFIFGLGLDYSIFITNACLKEYETGKPSLQTYQTSILISVITTLLGIGALIFAKHPALKSISLVSVIGILTAVSVAFILQTKLFEILFFNRKQKALPPFSFSGLVKSGRAGEKLYFQNAVLDNFRYKSGYSYVRKYLHSEKERFLKLSGFFDVNDRVLVINCGVGVLPIFLHKKYPELTITGFEPDKKYIEIAQNTHQAQHSNLNFSSDLEEAISGVNTLILENAPDFFSENLLKEVIPKKIEKVIILDSEYSYRWIIDLDFEIIYRQNGIIYLKKLD